MTNAEQGFAIAERLVTLAEKYVSARIAESEARRAADAARQKMIDDLVPVALAAITRIYTEGAPSSDVPAS